jgi:hypothetical protein
MAFGSNRNNQLSTKICAKDKPQNVRDQIREARLDATKSFM